jgi:serine protease Do
MMFSKGKLVAAFLVSALASAAVIAQTPAPSPAQPRTDNWTQLFSTGSGGYLGVQTVDVTKDNFSKFGLREVRGVAVEKVVENSPAAQAGLQDNDVIVRFNGEEITSVRKLTRLISEVAPDHRARITVLRGGSEREVTATLGRRQGTALTSGTFRTTVPAVPRAPSVPRVYAPPGGTVVTPEVYRDFFSLPGRQIGVGVSTLTKQLGDHFGVADGKGLLINNVRENSAAAKAGLRAGDVIVEVEGKAVGTMGELTRAINEKKEGDVSLTIIRNRNRQTIRVTPERAAEGENIQRLRDLMLQEGRVIQAPSRTIRNIRPTIVPSTRYQIVPRTL